MSLRLILGSLMALAIGLIASQGRAQAAQTPVSHFFKKPKLGTPLLSPDGKHIAVTAPSTAGDGRMTLAVANVEAPQKLTVVAHFDRADIAAPAWVNSKRLIFSTVDYQAEVGNQVGGGLYAVDIDSQNFVWLVERRSGEQNDNAITKRPLRGNHVLFKTLPGDGDDVLLLRYNERESQEEAISTTLVRLNTRSKSRTDLGGSKVPEGATDWVMSRGSDPQPVAVLSIVKERTRMHVADREGGWTSVAEYNTFTGGADYIRPAWADSKGQLYVFATQNNAEKTDALYRFDSATRKPEASPLLSLKGYDLDEKGAFFDRETEELLGVVNLTDATGVVWFNAQMKAVQAQVDKLLPGTNNLLGCSRCVNGRHVVVTAYSDRQSAVHFLFDMQTQKLELIGASRPWLDAAQMAERDFTRFTARDGTSVPVHVTKPKGKGPWPAVVLVHGGPFVRGGEWEWAPDGQFLASRGYAVIEPEYRGSTGFGMTHFMAGWKQWGLAMQDDVTDATHWAIKQKLADPQRIAIAGASYGGYATMMGLVKEPNLYRAGINWVGVTDINLMYDVGWSDFDGSDWSRYGMPRLVGDQVKDAKQLEETSPLKQAARITKPVLMAYGGEDYRVPLPHGTKMRDALRAAGKVEVEWVVYPEEGHGWMLEANNVDFWTRVEKFLAKNLQ